MKTTAEIRNRIRELSTADGSDDYDRAVLDLLDDFERAYHGLHLKPGDIVQWRCPRFSHVLHRWKVFGVYYGAVGYESLVEMESLTHHAGWTGPWEYHPRVFVPEVLLRQCVEIERQP